MEHTRSVTPTIEVEEGKLHHIWLISDPHFDHTNIIKYCDRPFPDVTTMNTTIQTNWNKMIAPADTVLFLGDMAFGRGSRTPRWWLTQLNGQFIYLKGSHDHGIRPYPSVYHDLEGKLLFVADAVIIKFRGYNIYVTHSPTSIPHSWKGWAIHGHVHDNQPFLNLKMKRINMSVEVNHYKPKTLYTLAMVMEMVD